MKKELVYKKQYKILLLELLSVLPNFVAMLVSAFFSSSLLVWLDVVESSLNAINIGFVIAISIKLTKNLKYKYNYGIEKIEALSALLSGTFELFSILIIFILSLTEMVSPDQPSKLLLLPILIKFINLLSNFSLLMKKKKLKHQTDSKILQTEYAVSLKTVMLDFTTFASIFVCWVFREYRIAWYFSPVMCIIIAIYIAHHSISGIITAISELTEKTLPEDEQLKILKCLSEFYSEYTELISVNSLVRGNTNYIELHLKFAPEMTFEQISDFKQRISIGIKEKIPNSETKIVI